MKDSKGPFTEYLKKWVMFLTGVNYPNRSGDIAGLALMATSILFATRKDGNEYWYYHTKNTGNIEIAKFLLARNGLDTEYYNNPNHFPGLRVPANVINTDKQKKQFVNDLNTAMYQRGAYVCATTVYLDRVCREMRDRSR